MIWCVEDDAATREIELYTLRSTGFTARGFADGDTFYAALAQERPDLVLLDVMLPGTDGIELLRKIRKSADLQELPIIMATAKGEEYDKIQSLDLGADDYLVKPFGMMEMVSRIKAVLRRCQKRPQTVLTVGEIKLNEAERTVYVADKRVNLTYKEFELLRIFLKQPGIAFTRDELFALVWENDYLGDSRTLDMHIRTLRVKLGEAGKYLETVRNVGYRLERHDDK